VLQVGEAHRALVERGRGTAFPESGQGPNGVVANDYPGIREDDLARGGLKRKDTPEGLTANLVLHVLRVGKGADDDHSLRVSPPADDSTPAVDRGIPSDGDHPGVASVASCEGVVQGAGDSDRGPEGTARLGLVLQYLANEDRCLTYCRRAPTSVSYARQVE
jgi:hypothetical protein